MGLPDNLTGGIQMNLAGDYRQKGETHSGEIRGGCKVPSACKLGLVLACLCFIYRTSSAVLLGPVSPISFSLATLPPKQGWPVPAGIQGNFNPTRDLLQQPKFQYGNSSIQQLFSSSFSLSSDMSAELDVISPGYLRNAHWWVQGCGRHHALPRSICTASCRPGTPRPRRCNTWCRG